MNKQEKKHSESKSAVVKELRKAAADEAYAVAFLERLRWGDDIKDVVCPKCGCVGNCVQIKDSETGERNSRFLWYCNDCHGQFSVRTNSVMERSHIPLTHWCAAFGAACSGKNGVSAKEISRDCQISYKSALFLMHRIRYAMEGPDKTDRLKGTVEVDETYIGGKPRFKNRGLRGRGTSKQPVLALVERDGNVKTRVIPDVSGKTLKPAIREEVDRASRIMTDEWPSYRGIGQEFDGGHYVVNHGSGEYSRGDIFTNTAESFFSILKRSIDGTYHSVSRKHLHRYLAEFAFRWDTRKNNDGERIAAAIRGAEGKRLMYREPSAA